MPDLSTEANLPSYSGTQTFGDGNDQPSYDSNANLPTYTAPSDDSYGTPAEHTIQKCKKMAGQNTFQILHLNDANMTGEH